MSHAARILVALIAVLAMGGCVTSPEAADGLAGKTVVVTGASSGFGRGIALELARQRANVVLVSRNERGLGEVAREAGGSTMVFAADVADGEQMRRLMEATVGRFGEIDVWINNAGVGAFGKFEEVPLEDQLRVVDVNLHGVILGSHYALRQFRRQGEGTLINIGSVEGHVPLPYQATYVATKHGVVGLGAALNQELRLDPTARDIHVVTVNPFATDTPFFNHAANYTGRAPRSMLLDPPEKVVAAVIGAIRRPRPEIAVGFKAKGAQASHRIMRRGTEAMVAALYHREQMRQAAPAPPTSGTLHDSDGRAGPVDGGNEERIALEDARNRGLQED
jgi:short-subunit dehydrogenase